MRNFNYRIQEALEDTSYIAQCFYLQYAHEIMSLRRNSDIQTPSEFIKAVNESALIREKFKPIVFTEDSYHWEHTTKSGAFKAFVKFDMSGESRQGVQANFAEDLILKWENYGFEIHNPNKVKIKRGYIQAFLDTIPWHLMDDVVSNMIQEFQKSHSQHLVELRDTIASVVNARALSTLEKAQTAYRKNRIKPETILNPSYWGRFGDFLESREETRMLQARALSCFLPK